LSYDAVTGGSKAFKCANCYEVFLSFDLEKVDIVPLSLFAQKCDQNHVFTLFCDTNHTLFQIL